MDTHDHQKKMIVCIKTRIFPMLAHAILTKPLVSKSTKDVDDDDSEKPIDFPSLIRFILVSALVLFALYLSFKRNDGFAFGPFLAAIFIPAIYIPYTYAVPIVPPV